MKVTNANSPKLQEVAKKRADKSESSAASAFSKAIDGKTGDIKGPNTPSTAALSSSSELDLSPRAKDMKRAKDVAMTSSPDIDEAKVARFQKLIDGGQYKVDSKSVADKLVDEHLLMAGTDTE